MVERREETLAQLTGSRLEATSDDLDAEALAMLKLAYVPHGAATRRQLKTSYPELVSNCGMRPMPNNYQQPVDRAKLLVKLRELEGEWRAFERRLREEERQIWQPDWSHGDALAERLSRAEYPQETVDALKKQLDVINRLLCGEPLSPDILKELDQMDAAERAAGESAVKQLAAIVIATPNCAPQVKPPQWPRYGVEVSRISKTPNTLGFIRFVG
jgi:hypothetical protein